MKTVRRLIYREVLISIAYVTLAFLGLFFFFDVVDELQSVGKHSAQGYTIAYALLYVALLIPSHLYEFLPMMVLIGTVAVMARLAQSSEYTILRTSGLGPWRALHTLLVLGLGFVVLTFAIGDYVAPASDRTAQLLKSGFEGRITNGQTGAWLKEKQQHNSYAVNVGAISAEGSMLNIRIYEFDARGALVSQTLAPHGSFSKDGAWLLDDADRSEFQGNSVPSRGSANAMNSAKTTDLTKAESAGSTGSASSASNNAAPNNAPASSTATPVGVALAALPRTQINRGVVNSYRWPTEITPEMVSVALLKPERMATLDLFRYMRHLDANGQSAQRYEIEFWKKVFYPLACLVMVVLALPFAYIHFRTAGITTYAVGGVMIGLSFFMVNTMVAHIGNLRNWQPWITAASPGLLYSVLSLAAFTWLVLRR